VAAYEVFAEGRGGGSPGRARHGGLSVVIPSYHRDRDLEAALGSIRANSSSECEILVMSPDTGQGIAALCRANDARLVDDNSRTDGTRSRSLWAIINHGIEAARGDFVCWLNDDCLVNRGWDSIALPYFTDEVGMVVLKTKGINQDPEYTVRGGYHGIPVANYAILRKSSGVRFDEGFSWFYGDADNSLRMALETDYRIVGTRENLVIHNHRVDEVRRGNEEDPRTGADRGYFERKWRYTRRAGDRVVRMNTLEKGAAAALDLLRSAYHFVPQAARLRLKNGRVRDG